MSMTSKWNLRFILFTDDFLIKKFYFRFLKNEIEFGSKRILPPKADRSKKFSKK